MLKNYKPDGDFYKKRGHAVTAALGFLFLTIAYLFGKEVNMVYYADLAMLTGFLAMLPRIQMNGVESSAKFAKNTFGYFILILTILVAIGDMFGWLSLDPDTKTEYFSILTTICGALFGVTKIDISPTSIETARRALLAKYRDTVKKEEDKAKEEVYEGDFVQKVARQELDTISKAVSPPEVKDTLLSFMEKYDGMCEESGEAHNEKLLELGKNAGFSWFVRDEIPWCAIIMNVACKGVGLPTTDSAMAKSFETWGKPVSLEYARKHIGNVIALFHRGTDATQPEGHVTVVKSISEDGTNIVGKGGNQGNCLKDSTFNIDSWRFIGFRAPKDNWIDG